MYMHYLLMHGKGNRTMLALKRVYEPPAPADGTRILVDRLWPRGIARDKARIELWLKDIAPSDALRRRFHARPADWETFVAAYAAELEGARRPRRRSASCGTGCERAQSPCSMPPATSAATTPWR